MKKIGIFAKVHDPRCQSVAVELVSWLRSRGIAPLVEEHLARHLKLDCGSAREDIPPQVDLVVVLGGDGTLISVARLVGTCEIPILGVNLGSLGFLTEITVEELYDSLDGFLAGDYRISPRMMLLASVEREGQELTSHQVLNDVVVNKGALARIIDMEVVVGGHYLTTFKADGLIISSPTGSTGYSLSANGPILQPSLDSLVITPICPHTLTNRPVVVDAMSEVVMTLRSANEDVYLTLDGQVGFELKYADVIRVRKAAHHTRLVMSPRRNFFEVLRTKLKWGER